MYNIIDTISEELFDFGHYDSSVLSKIDEVHICGNKDESFCILKDDKNKLMIPHVNLYNGENNKDKYLSDITYDLLLNTDIQSNTNDSISFMNYDVPYKINYKNEIILLKTKINEYFDSLNQNIRSSYVKQEVYDDLVHNEIMNYVNSKKLTKHRR